MKYIKLFEEFIGENISNLDISKINPTKKDYDRAEGLRWKGKTFKGNNSPFRSEAQKMAKLIRDPKKLVRRAKAVADMYGTYEYFYKPSSSTDSDDNVWLPFANALLKMGFTKGQLEEIVSK